MPANRRRSAITAPRDRWVLLGSRLELRRRTLGHTYRTTFERERGVNKRLAADIEKAPEDRVSRYMPGTLQLVAQGYAVTHESVLALLRGEADDLVTVPPISLIPSGPASPAEPPGWAPPMADAARTASARPYADRIWERLRQLAARGVTEPSGAQVFGPGTPDAATWDGVGARLDLPDRVWLIADLQRRGDGRAPRAGAAAPGA